jgi:parallel beta helix pectate lyase-like protein
MGERPVDHGDIVQARLSPFPWLATLLLIGWWGAVCAEAAVYYVDGNCPGSGSGATTACGTSGPKKTVMEGIALLAAPGDVLQVRGVHAAHDGETGKFDGRYFTDSLSVTISGGSSHPIVIQPYRYVGLRTGEGVYIEGTKAPSGGWTQCTNCTSGVCAGVSSTGCSQTWYATDTVTATKVIGAEKDDGSPTYRVTSSSDLTNDHPTYNSKRCRVDTWKACNLDADCGPGETCTATSPEIDSYSPQLAGGTILVRWGASLPERPYVFNDNNGNGFMFSSSSRNITIQGFNFRCFRRSAIYVAPASGTRNILIKDNRVFYGMDVRFNGSDYGMSSYGSTKVAIQDNEIAYTGSEGVHTESGYAASILTITGNYIHHQGDQTVLGPGTIGTPSGMILGQYQGTSGPGEYTGSVVSGNLIAYQGDSSPLGSTGRGIILENNSNSWTIRDNVFYRIPGECIKLTPSGNVSTSGSVIFNNLFLDCGLHGGNVTGNGPGIWIDAGAATVRASDNVIYNNTFVDNNNGMIALATGGTVSGNVIRNNIGYDSGDKKMVTWPSYDPSNIFENNLIMSAGMEAGSTLVTWRGARASGGPGYTCAQIGHLAASNKCVDPMFVAAGSNDYHIQRSSAAKDSGTSTGMPTVRTASINNGLVGLHGFPSYSDNVPLSGLGWDVGAVEVASSVTTASVWLSDRPPTASGSVTVALTTSTNVIVLPGPLMFVGSEGSITAMPLIRTVPGTVFLGTLLVDGTVPDGRGPFLLPSGSLMDGRGSVGNMIVNGSRAVIEKTPPSKPANLRLGNY